MHRGITDTLVGGIITRFYLRRRRSTLFFEDIAAQYFKECDEAGKGDELAEISRKWFYETLSSITTPRLKSMGYKLLVNRVFNAVWKNSGNFDDVHILRDGDLMTFTSKNESITRIIGKNSFYEGIAKGFSGVIFDSNAELVEAKQGPTSKYVVRLIPGNYEYQHKPRETYRKENALPAVSGFTLSDALKSGVFTLSEDNKIRFRGKLIWYVENTLFHLIGNEGILLDRVPHISYDYFKGLVESDSKPEDKLQLLKTLLQVMGWGIVTISIGEKETKVCIKNLPSGFQLEPNNYNFLANTILGYMWLINKKTKITKTSLSSNVLTLTFS